MLKPLVLSLIAATVALAGPRDRAWTQVRAALERGLPSTALTQVRPILQGALGDGAHAEAIKALALTLTLESRGQADPDAARIARMQAELGKAPAAMKPVLEVVLANW